MRSILQFPKGIGVHLVATHKSGDEWVGDKKTGRVEMKGFSDTPYLTDWVLRLELNKDEKKGGNYGVIEASRFGLSFNGLAIANPTYDALVKLTNLQKG
jgi:hypothetical protein